MISRINIIVVVKKFELREKYKDENEVVVEVVVEVEVEVRDRNEVKDTFYIFATIRR